MEISFVVAASENNVIGVNNQLPWHLPLDLKFFKRMTTGKPIVMGRKTLASLEKPLPGRLNVILSRSLEEAPEGCVLFRSLSEALAYLREANYPEISIIGGGEVFSESLAMVDIIYLTRVHAIIENGEAFFPEFRDSGDFELEWEEKHEVDERHAYSFTIQKWVRKEGK